MSNYNAIYYISFNKKNFDFDLMDGRSIGINDKYCKEKMNELSNTDLIKNIVLIYNEKKLSRPILFCNNSIEHHAKVWKKCSENKKKLIMFSDNVRFREQIDFKEFEYLLDDYDFLYNEDYSIYLMSEKFCSHMNTVNKGETTLSELFSSLEHNFKQDLLILGDQKCR